jgi:hypothetical protein
MILPGRVSGNGPDNGGWIAQEVSCMDRTSGAQQQCGADEKAGNNGEELIADGEDFKAVHFGSPEERFNFVPRGWGMCGMPKVLHRPCQF